MYLKVELLPSHWVYFTTCHNWTHGDFFHLNPLPTVGYVELVPSWSEKFPTSLVCWFEQVVGYSTLLEIVKGIPKFSELSLPTDTDQFKKYLTLSWWFFCWKHFLFPLHHVAEIHRLHQFSISSFVHFLCKDFVQHSTVQICLFSERSMKPLASWELAIQKKILSKESHFLELMIFPTSPLESMEYVVSILLCLRLQTEPRDVFWKASSHDLFSSTHWKNNLDLWTNERRLRHGYLKITWLNW